MVVGSVYSDPKMLTPKPRQAGFTIVELLIVVVVIAILAAISIVAYTGISDRAYNSAVQNDIRNFANKIIEYNALNGGYPVGGRPSGATTSSHLAIPNVDSYPFARSSYAADVNNIYYCERNGTFAVAAKSKSGRAYRYDGGGGLSEYAGTVEYLKQCRHYLSISTWAFTRSDRLFGFICVPPHQRLGRDVSRVRASYLKRAVVTMSL